MWNSISDYDRMFMTQNLLHRRVSSLMKNHSDTAEYVGSDNVAVNLYDDETRYCLAALLPGVAKEDVEIEVNGRDLFLEARFARKVPEGYGARGGQRKGFVAKRRFQLPVDVEVDNVEVSLKDGVLTLIIPKAKKVQPIKIAVQ